MDKKPLIAPSSPFSPTAPPPSWNPLDRLIQSSALIASSSNASSTPVLPGVEEDLLNALNEWAYQFFQSPSLAYNLNYGRFCEYTGLGRKNRKSLGLGGSLCFDFWKQWIYRVSVGSDREYPSSVQDAVVEERVKLLMKVPSRTLMDLNRFCETFVFQAWSRQWSLSCELLAFVRTFCGSRLG